MTATDTTASCDYAGYDYKTEFWEKSNRKYEDVLEKKTIQRLLKPLLKNKGAFLDAGCGFGRLFPAYGEFGESFFMVDYAQNMLDQAKETLPKEKDITFLQGDLKKLPLNDNVVDAAISIRTLHHIDEPPVFFKEMYRVLNNDGVFLFEVPNKGHLINLCRYFFGKLPVSPFNFDRLNLGDHFFNYHPKEIEQQVEKSGFEIIKRVPLSFFRVGILKKYVPYKTLVSLDLTLQRVLSWTRLTPSIYFLCRKRG